MRQVIVRGAENKVWRIGLRGMAWNKGCSARGTSALLSINHKTRTIRSPEPAYSRNYQHLCPSVSAQIHIGSLSSRVQCASDSPTIGK